MSSQQITRACSETEFIAEQIDDARSDLERLFIRDELDNQIRARRIIGQDATALVILRKRVSGLLNAIDA